MDRALLDRRLTEWLKLHPKETWASAKLSYDGADQAYILRIEESDVGPEAGISVTIHGSGRGAVEVVIGPAASSPPP